MLGTGSILDFHLLLWTICMYIWDMLGVRLKSKPEIYFHFTYILYFLPEGNFIQYFKFYGKKDVWCRTFCLWHHVCAWKVLDFETFWISDFQIRNVQHVNQYTERRDKSSLFLCNWKNNSAYPGGHFEHVSYWHHDSAMFWNIYWKRLE
jgi:hypothetical protein